MLNGAERLALEKRVKNYFVNNPNISKADAANHFIQEGICRKTAYNYINRELNGQSLQIKKNSGRPTSWSKEKLAKLKKLTNNRKGVSQRKLGRKFGVNHSTISRQLAKMKISYRKREKTLKYNEAQRLKAQKNCRKLVNHLYKKQNVVILDDEKYFCFAGNEMPGNAGYYTDDKEKFPENISKNAWKKDFYHSSKSITVTIIICFGLI